MNEAPSVFKSAVYTPATLAKRWECSERHVRNMIASGDLPAFRLSGKLLRIRAVDVEALEARPIEPGVTPELVDKPPRKKPQPRLDLPKW